MTSLAQFYPEFDSTEIAETITPLREFDDQVVSVLLGARESAADAVTARSVTQDDGSRAGSGTATEPRWSSDPGLDALIAPAVTAWREAVEEYPFQRVVRTAALELLGADPLTGYVDLLADPRRIVVELLDRAENRLRVVYTRPLVAAVNHARESGRLRGDNPQQRYASFVEQACRVGWEQISGLSFPVLGRITGLVLRNEVDAFRELCARLVADRNAIRDAFRIDRADRLQSIGTTEGDTHNHGRSVSVLVFESGARLVYKPRDVSCEAAYATLAQEANVWLGTGLVTATVLERAGYGYVEFVETEDVGDLAGPFMSASGELAAVLYLLNARDMHFENILPTRRGPVPVDLETILHPERIHVGPTPEAPGNAYAAIAESVYGVGILPLVMVGRDADDGHVDLGFLGGQGQGNAPFKAIQFVNPFTDRVSLAFGPVAAAERTTVARTVSEDEVRELGRQVAEGFSRVVRAVLDDPERWIALLHKTMADVRVRYVHNPTALYGQTLRMTSGPSALDGDTTYLALLKRIAIASKTSDRQIVRSELRQLAERDIPYFLVAGTSTTLTTGDGATVGAVFPRSPLDLAVEKASRLDEAALAEQLRLIHSAFSSRFPDNHLAPADGGAEAAADEVTAGAPGEAAGG
ncbi:MAG TPA: type 2 lanthipeptide synthetase LanM, partial [Kineosporiaceae bacterium]|nr:type 2 lanthipeptide synthetase LanM [Kineosporiaceae bacterium]